MQIFRLNGITIKVSILYLCLVSLDLLGTYINTPDLKHEHNFLIKNLELSWFTIIISALICSGLLLYINIIIDKYYTERLNLNKKLTTIQIILFVFLRSVLCAHFFYSCFLIINNGFAFFYIYEINYFKEIAYYYFLYIGFVLPYYYIALQLFAFIISSFFICNNVKSKNRCFCTASSSL